MRSLGLASLFAFALTLVACGTFDAASFRKTELTRASFELGCKPDGMTVKDVGEREVGVTGCGKRAVYVVAPDGGWVNNTGVQQDTTPPAAP